MEVIRSEETTGPVTSLALSAVNKFLSYGLIGEQATLINIAILKLNVTKQVIVHR